MSAIGLDIGGTSVRVVLLESDGTIAARGRLTTSAERGASDTLERIIYTTKQLVADVAKTPVEALGVGITGPVDVVTGIVSNPFTLGGWPPTDLREPFSNAFGVPVAIDNDANVAAIGEWWVGAGRGAARMTMITIGTGIGVATLIDGKLQRTSSGMHGEAGHMVLNPFAEKCYCGARGCWEVLASGTALDRHAREMAKSPESLLWKMTDGNAEQATGELLFAAAAAGEDAARQVINEVATWWGLGLVNLASTTMPDVFVLSGGVVESFEVVRAKVRQVLDQHSAMIPTNVPIEAAVLGDDAGAIGAAKSALDLLQKLSH